MRTSSPTLAAAFIDGALEQGADVVDYGMCATDMLYFGVVRDGLEGGAQITASHNPGEYNGIKIVVKNRATGGLDIVRPVDYCEAAYRADGEKLPDASAAFSARAAKARSALAALVWSVLGLNGMRR